MSTPKPPTHRYVFNDDGRIVTVDYQIVDNGLAVQSVKVTFEEPIVVNDKEYCVLQQDIRKIFDDFAIAGNLPNSI